MIGGGIDIFATKGVEYLIVIGYLALFIPFFILLARTRRPEEAAESGFKIAAPVLNWFQLPVGVSVHPGHAWAVAEDDGLVRVGIDNFASRLLGAPSSADLPSQGKSVHAGDTGWRLDVDGSQIEVLSPVSGVVSEVNGAVIDDPSLVSSDPYGDGWLMKIRPEQADAALRSLLSGQEAEAWMRASAEAMQVELTGPEGVVLQDGGELMPGFGRHLGEERWPALVERFLRTKLRKG